MIISEEQITATTHCDCELQETLEQLECRHLARATVPFQVITKLYCPEEGLIKGTIFPELYQPYHRVR